MQTSSTSFQLADGNGYMLASGHRAASRLNLQHFLWREVFGFNIHPSIPLPQEHPIIADIAFGTGLWLVDVSRALPNAHLDGLDIDLTQAPSADWLPPNIQLREWDIFDEVPSDLVGRYDFIHVRLLVMVLSGVDPKPVIRNLMRLVKPGGYVQWDELDCVHMRVKKIDESIDTPALEELCHAMYSDGRHDWVLSLPRMLVEEGFVNVRIEQYDEKPELVRAFNDQHLLTTEEFATRLMEKGHFEAARRFGQLIQMGYEESLTGAALSIPRVVVTGKRPLQCSLS